MEFFDIQITRSPLRAPTDFYSPAAGAVLDFWGVVRELEGTQIIAGIEYETFEEMALHELRAVTTQVSAKFNLLAVTLHHRVGWVPVAEASLFLRVFSAHRQNAFAGSQEIIELLKQRVPIWKKPLSEEAKP